MGDKKKYKSGSSFFKRFSMHKIPRKRIKYTAIAVAALFIVEYFGLYVHLFESDFHTAFDYPLSENIMPYIEQLKNNDKPKLDPINWYNYTFLTNCNHKCSDPASHIRLVILVKSAIDNFDKRRGIRSTWGYERRFSDVNIRTVFLLGTNPDIPSNIQDSLSEESRKHKDIIQADFVDSYYNNTIKTMMGFKWATTFCPKANFYLFSDDDMYVSVKNVLRFIRNPSHYPEYVEESLTAIRKLTNHGRGLKSVPNNSVRNVANNSFYDSPYLSQRRKKFRRRKRQILGNYELPDDALLYSGFVFTSSPHRHKSSKWYVPLSEYPWHMWPPYVSAGAYIVSREVLATMYYASFYIKHFRFDDIYLGLLAKKCDIEPFHCKEFYFYKKEYNVHNYRYVVASHGYSDPSELINVWNEQKSAGNA